MRIDSRVVAVITILLACIVCEAADRRLKQLPTKQRSEYSKQITKVLRGQATLTSDLIKNRYLNTLLSDLTQPTAGRNAHLTRTTIVQDLQTAAERAPSAHGPIRDSVYSYCGKIVDPKNGFSVVAQYNAMLIIGSLNQQEATKKSNKPPVPYAPALKNIGGALKTSSKDNDAVKVAALIGLQRHARLDRIGVPMDKRYKAAFTKLLQGILVAECPANRSKEGHEWIQRKAMAILAEFGAAGPGGELVKTLDQIIRNEDASLAMRCSALDALDRIKITSDPGINVQETKMGLATATVKVCRTVSKRLEKRYVDRDSNGGGFAGGGGGGYGGGGYGGGGYGGGGYGGGSSSDGGGGGGYGSGYGSGYGGGGGGGYGSGYGGGEEGDLEEQKPEEDPLLTEARRDIKQRLGCVTKGITTIARLAPKDRQLNDLGKLVSALMKSIDAEELALSTFNDEVKKLATDVEEIFGIETEEAQPPQIGPGGRMGFRGSMDG